MGDLALIKDFNLPAIGEAFADSFAEEMEGLPTTFDRVKIPSGGGLTFEAPGDDPENPDAVKELVGIIVDHYPVNAYWADKYSGQNNPPDCASLDGKYGIDRNTGAKNPCNICPENEWGSDGEGNGKACKNMHRVYLLRAGEMFPLLLTLPPTSIRNFADYLAKRVVSKGRRSYGVITKVTLKKAANASGIQYSQAQFAVAGVLPDEQLAQIEAYVQSIRPMTRAMAVADDEYIQKAADNASTQEDEDSVI